MLVYQRVIFIQHGLGNNRQLVKIHSMTSRPHRSIQECLGTKGDGVSCFVGKKYKDENIMKRQEARVIKDYKKGCFQTEGSFFS